MWSGHHEQAQPAASGGAGTWDTTAELNLNFAWAKLLLVAYSAANLSQLSRSSLDLSSACERPLYLIYICDEFFISQHASKMDNSGFIFLTCLIQTCKQACKTMCKSCLMHSCPWEIHSRLFFFFKIGFGNFWAATSVIKINCYAKWLFSEKSADQSSARIKDVSSVRWYKSIVKRLAVLIVLPLSFFLFPFLKNNINK